MTQRTLRGDLIRLAAAKPELRSKVLPLLKEARGFGVGKIKPGGSTSFSAEGVYVHVWFDSGVARTDYGHREPDSGEWQVIVSTSPDKLNMKPRGRELARQVFRYADPKQRNLVMSSAEDYIRRSLFKYRKSAAEKKAGPVKYIRMWTRFKQKSETPRTDGGKDVKGVIECGFPNAHDVSVRFSASLDPSGGLLDFNVRGLTAVHPTKMFWMDVFIELYF